jgi:hypothetical protein
VEQLVSTYARKDKLLIYKCFIKVDCNVKIKNTGMTGLEPATLG